MKDLLTKKSLQTDCNCHCNPLKQFIFTGWF